MTGARSPEHGGGAAPPDGAKKRRLPILQPSEAASPAQVADEERPAWQWAVIGVVCVFVVWLPLAMLLNGPVAAALGASPTTPSAILAVSNGLAFAAAAFLGGVFARRFGARARGREAVISGAAAAAIACGPAAVGAGARTLLALPLLVLVGGLAAGAGGLLGARHRRMR